MITVKLNHRKDIVIPSAEVEFTFSRSSGPGGQNVNKVNSKATLRWAPSLSDSLPLEVRDRFRTIFATKLTSEGELVLSSDRFRDRGMNIDDCIDKLIQMVAEAAIPPKNRKATKPTFSSKKRKETSKKSQKERKQNRSKIRF